MSSSCLPSAYGRICCANIQKASGAVPPATPVWRVDQNSGYGRSCTLTVMFGFAFSNAAAISFIAGVWVPAQIPYVMVTFLSLEPEPVVPPEQAVSRATLAATATAASNVLRMDFLSYRVVISDQRWW